jgi:hypothetical protein
VVLAAVVVAGLSLVTTVFLGWRALRLARHSNTMPVLIDLFREHRSERLAEARKFIHNDLGECDASRGLDGLPERGQDLLRDLGWFYDNLGALVAHGVVDLDAVSGYLGGSVVASWNAVRAVVLAERAKRQGFDDPDRWQIYFENLYELVQQLPPERARSSQKLWRLNNDGDGLKLSRFSTNAPVDSRANPKFRAQGQEPMTLPRQASLPQRHLAGPCNSVRARRYWWPVA